MKTRAIFLIAGVLVAILCKSFGQVASNATFTRITTGAIVTDSAHSFGSAWGDYDGDGYLDLIVGNGLGDANALYHNNGNGTFTRITTNVIATTVGDTDGVVWADYDNDGDLDLFVANWKLGSFLFRNDGNGNFTRMLSAGILSGPADSNGAAWGDYDNDGFIDLVVANSNGQNEHLYRNNGNGTFTQIFSGVIPNSGHTSFGPRWLDYDNDGRLDLFISPASTNNENLLFRNNGVGVFNVVSGSPLTSVGGGNDWGDFDNNGDLDLFDGYWRGPGGRSAVIYRNDGGAFTRILMDDIVRNGGHIESGGAWGDYDNDGWLDLFAHNVLLGGTNVLYHNNGDGTFTPVIDASLVRGSTNAVTGVWADYDNDGFLDLFVASGQEAASEPNFLYHNNGNSNRWLTVKCIGSASNRSGIGAKVRVRATINGALRWQMRDINSGNGFNGGGLRACFGLGNATNADIVRIEWPSGTVQDLRNVAANQILAVTEPPALTVLGKDVSGAFRLSLRGGVGVTYTVQRSTNMINWNLLTSFIPTNIVSPFSDTGAVSSPMRFYRAQEGD